MPRFATASIAVLLLALAGCSGGSSSTAAALSEMDLENMLTLDDALAIARAEVPDGYTIGAELELEDDDEDEPPAWEVSLFVPGSATIMEVEIHYQTGEVLEVEVEDDGPDDD